MPPRKEIAPAVFRRMEDMLRAGSSATEVYEALCSAFPDDDAIPLPARIRTEAYRLGIGLRSGPRAGMPGIGRPKGPGKKFSKNRERVLDLYEQGHVPSVIAGMIGITRQGVQRIITDERNKKDKC